MFCVKELFGILLLVLINFDIGEAQFRGSFFRPREERRFSSRTPSSQVIKAEVPRGANPQRINTLWFCGTWWFQRADFFTSGCREDPHEVVGGMVYFLGWRCPGKYTWQGAVNFCREKNMKLVSLDDNSVNEELFRLVRRENAPYYWSGGEIIR